jgi:hypothetical protein
MRTAHAKPMPLWRWLLLMLVVVLVFLGTLVFGADEMCRRDIAERQPLYPGAEIIETDYNFLRPRAMGTTHLTLLAPDDTETVRAWIRETNLRLLRAERFRGLANTMWEVYPNPEGEGTLMRYYSSCGE